MSNYELYPYVYGDRRDPDIAAKEFDFELHRKTLEDSAKREQDAEREYKEKNRERFKLQRQKLLVRE